MLNRFGALIRSLNPYRRIEELEGELRHQIDAWQHEANFWRAGAERQAAYISVLDGKLDDKKKPHRGAWTIPMPNYGRSYTVHHWKDVDPSQELGRALLLAAEIAHREKQSSIALQVEYTIDLY